MRHRRMHNRYRQCMATNVKKTATENKKKIFSEEQWQKEKKRQSKTQKQKRRDVCDSGERRERKRKERGHS